MKKTLLLIIVLLSLIFTKAYAQIDPNFFNLNIVNPAFVGSKDNFSLGLSRSLDFVKFGSDGFDFKILDGAPKSFIVNAYTPIKEKFGAGVSFVGISIGPVRESIINADFSYKIDLSEDSKLSFGLKGGVTSIKINTIQLILPHNPGNDLFASDISDTNPNFGIGVYYDKNNFSLGFSVPNFLSKGFESNNSTIISVKQGNSYIISSSYMFSLSDNIEFTSAGILAMFSKRSPTYYMTGNFNFKKILGIGVNYSKNNFGILLSTPKVADIFRLGLRVEFPSNNDFENVEFFGNADFNSFIN